MTPWNKLAQSKFGSEWTETSLRVAIVAVAVFAIVLSMSVRDKWVLAGILAYLVLP